MRVGGGADWSPRFREGKRDSEQQDSPEALVVPGGFVVTEREVEHATIAVLALPGERVLAVGSASLRRVDRGEVEAQDDFEWLRREVLELVDLVRDLEVRSNARTRTD